MSNHPRARRAAALALLVGVTLGACGSDDEPAVSPAPSGTTGDPAPSSASSTTQATAPEPRVSEFSFDVTGGTVAGGAQRIDAEVGEPVRLVVRSDEADEVHLHGYDLRADVGPGAPATIDFTADIPGVFEIELHDSGVRLAELAVQ